MNRTAPTRPQRALRPQHPMSSIDAILAAHREELRRIWEHHQAWDRARDQDHERYRAQHR